MRFLWLLSVFVLQSLYFIPRGGSHFNSFIFSNTISGFALNENRSYMKLASDLDWVELSAQDPLNSRGNHLSLCCLDTLGDSQM